VYLQVMGDPHAFPNVPGYSPSNDSLHRDVQGRLHASVSELFDFVEGKHTGDLAAGNMPFWTSEDTRNALLSTLVPGGAAVAAFGLFVNDKDTVNWWNVQKKPKWAPTDVRLYSAIDILTLSPLGYASYLVYKNGGGFDYSDTRVALGIYGANIMLALATVPLVKKRNLKCLFLNTSLLHLTATAAAVAFYKIDQRAGLWLVPYALWTAFYSYLTYSIWKENEKVKL